MTPSTLTGCQRTLDFLAGKKTDRPPFHPIIMRWAAAYAGVKYRDFCLDAHDKCHAMIKCAEDFDLDWVTVMSDPYAEASAFGIQVEYPEDSLPMDCGGHLADLDAVRKLAPYRVADHLRTRNRLEEIHEYRRRCGEKYFIVGWVEGPVAEYADIRGITEAAMDMMDDPETVGRAMDIITDCALEFITDQVKAGAHCIGVGDAFTSQIGPDLYRQFAFEREKRMVDHIHSLGAKAKLHICGNTSDILPDMIATGADIIDVDHLVPSFTPFMGRLAPTQVFSGKADPVSVIQDGTPQQIEAAVRRDLQEAKGRCIVSAGCEITPGTTVENMRLFRKMANAT